jgi:hypothetical protein
MCAGSAHVSFTIGLTCTQSEVFNIKPGVGNRPYLVIFDMDSSGS